MQIQTPLKRLTQPGEGGHVRKAQGPTNTTAASDSFAARREESNLRLIETDKMWKMCKKTAAVGALSAGIAGGALASMGGVPGQVLGFGAGLPVLAAGVVAFEWGLSKFGGEHLSRNPVLGAPLVGVALAASGAIGLAAGFGMGELALQGGGIGALIGFAAAAPGAPWWQ